jgi:hypothetical protein
MHRKCLGPGIFAAGLFRPADFSRVKRNVFLKQPPTDGFSLPASLMAVCGMVA